MDTCSSKSRRPVGKELTATPMQLYSSLQLKRLRFGCPASQPDPTSSRVEESDPAGKANPFIPAPTLGGKRRFSPKSHSRNEHISVMCAQRGLLILARVHSRRSLRLGP